jgi:hypothetical protein
MQIKYECAKSQKRKIHYLADLPAKPKVKRRFYANYNVECAQLDILICQLWELFISFSPIGNVEKPLEKFLNLSLIIESMPNYWN